MPSSTQARPKITEAELELAATVERSPAFFATEILGHDHWKIPHDVLDAIARPRARVAVKACHASSKTFTAADVVLWWTWAGGIVVTTAPTWTQVKELLWAEIHRAHENSRYPLGGTLHQTEIRLAPDQYAIGLSTDQGVRFQGWHGKVLVVLDEAPGVRADVWDAIEGIRAGGDVRVLALGNPVVPSGPFYDVFEKNRSGWSTFTIDAFQTPNLEGLTLEQLLALPDHELDVAPRPYLVTRRWVAEKHSEWGEQSPLWQAKVRGQFPKQGEDSLLWLAWLEAASTRTIQPADPDAWQAGIDVAGPGEDETSLTIRHGPRIAHQHHWAQPDPRGDVLNELAPYRERLASVKVDSIGQGYYFARHLEDNGYAGRVVDVNVGESPTDKERYANLKAELYWGLRLRAESGDLAGLTDDLTLSQLASIRYTHNARGQVVIEPKEVARKRGVKSPDRAESVMLAFANVDEARTVAY